MWYSVRTQLVVAFKDAETMPFWLYIYIYINFRKKKKKKQNKVCDGNKNRFQTFKWMSWLTSASDGEGVWLT